MRILLVEDDPMIGEAVLDALRAEPYAVDWVRDGAMADTALTTGTYDLDKDRLELWIRAAFAEEESQRTRERRKSQYERWRRDGRVGCDGDGRRRRCRHRGLRRGGAAAPG